MATLTTVPHVIGSSVNFKKRKIVSGFVDKGHSGFETHHNMTQPCLWGEGQLWVRRAGIVTSLIFWGCRS